MGLEKDVMHVVIKLPFKRPSDFVEPPPVVWTDDMEHQLWKHMNQKHTDWNYIAEQFGVPTPYLVRHAAFMYETQLRGIQQQLRLSEAGRPTTISSSPPPAVSTSTSSSNTYRSSRPSSQRQVRPVSSSSTSSRTQQQQQQRNSTLWKDAQEQPDDEPSTPSMTPATTRPTGGSATSIHIPSTSLAGSDQHTTTRRSIASSSMDIEAAAMATAPRYQHSPNDDSMMLSTISNISPRNNMYDTNKPTLENQSPSMTMSRHQASDGSDDHGSTSRYRISNNDDDDDDGFSTHFENMKLEEPAFLPSRRMEGSQLLSSLRASSYQSRSSLASPATVSTPSPPKPSTPPSSQRSPPSSEQPLDPSKISPTSSPHEMADDDIENKTASNHNDDASDTSSNGKAKMVFGPNLSRTATTQPSDESNKDANSALNSVGSSFSDLSDYSVTLSAMEDAFLSKMNNGSKMSSLAFSRKYT